MKKAHKTMRLRLPPLNAIKAFEAAARLGSFSRAAEELNVTHGAVSRQIRALEDWLGVPLFRRTSRNAVPTQAGATLLAEAGPALNQLAEGAHRVRVSSLAQGVLNIATQPTFSMRWLIPRLSDFQRDRAGLELRIVTARTAAERFQMEADVVVSGPSPQPGWIGTRFLGEALLPLLSPELMAKSPLRRPEDLRHHTLLHAATRRNAWVRWLEAAGIPDMKPAGDQVFEHFYFAIQAALAGVGVVMGPLALVTEEVQSGRLLAPIERPTVASRGYFLYAPAASNDAPAIVALRQWLIDAGQTTEATFPEYLG
ncbi:MAG TPA: transcriptional regulator GcvA [Stellaceae bacterium]|nr:transcriptional regulator GcvA [Stellaceae bacterium]